MLLAPAYCMAFFHATKRRLVVAWIVTAGVVVLIVLVGLTPQPWRGIIDAGVIVGLGYGVVSILLFIVWAVSGRVPLGPPEVPEATEAT